MNENKISTTYNCFGRISEKNLNELSTLDDLILRMGTTTDGRVIGSIGEPKEFKQRLETFKTFLASEYPEFTELEILKFDKFFHKLKDIYNFSGVEYYLAAIEFEKLKNL